MAWRRLDRGSRIVDVDVNGTQLGLLIGSRKNAPEGIDWKYAAYPLDRKIAVD